MNFVECAHSTETAPCSTADFIPVARIADTLLHPGRTIDYDGRRLTLPELRMIYWCGGNPFHHHQDLHRLARAWQTPDTVVVHEAWWNTTAKFADIVLPVATSLERDDFAAGFSDPHLVAMPRVREPAGESRTDHHIFSEEIDSFGYDDCVGHPAWFEPVEWLRAGLSDRFPLHLISNQPASRLHSQYDNGGHSLESKIRGREPVTINPLDAASRGIESGRVVRVHNDRGSCLAGAVLSDDVMPGVIQLSTGAWWDPAQPGRSGTLDRHGNPNTLTADRGCSRLSQGPSAHSALVDVEPYDGPLPDVLAFAPPHLEH
ncbi:molybdopterin dinucleotide binding domain-containing protein [Streptomyces sp. NPDC005899]|uniref:molybdopterin dinucleotide binding domain-containing protein n=1 Tax=Streptomyces sp. NPDC005899 TaxID=3155716 RepID=UPI0033C9AF49